MWSVMGLSVTSFPHLNVDEATWCESAWEEDRSLVSAAGEAIRDTQRGSTKRRPCSGGYVQTRWRAVGPEAPRHLVELL